MSAIDDYLKSVAPTQRAELEKVVTLVRHLVPDTEEKIAYGVPTFKYKGKNMLHFAAFKDHMSLFPGSQPIAAFADQLKGYKTTKGTIQFTLEKPLPEPLLKDIILQCRDTIDKTTSFSR